MLDSRSVSRRKLLRGAGMATGAAACSSLGIPRCAPGEALNRKGRVSPTDSFVADVDIALSAAPKAVGILPGDPTECWIFTGDLLHGDPHALELTAPSSYLGPTIRVRRGQKIRIRFTSNVAEPTIVHWHGLHVPAEMDGHPRYAVSKGQSFVYEFEVQNRAGTYWYHAHPDGFTGPQVYRGLAGLFIVEDPEDDALALPRGTFDVPLVIQDRLFGRDNQLLYSNSGSQAMTGFLGDRILVNGRPSFALPVSTRAYRLRILNGSNSRIYKLAFGDGTPLVIIGTDGGLLEEPVSRSSLFLGPAERVELWVDFSERTVGSQAELVSLPFDIGTPSMGMGPRPSAPANGAALTVMKFHVLRKEPEPLRVPKRLIGQRALGLADAVNASRPRDFPLFMSHMHWTIAGRTFGMTDVASDEKVRLGKVEAWRFRNQPGGGMGMGMMMQMAHPMHIHGGQFRVVDRRGPLFDGLLDLGWKDTVLVMPGQDVTIVMAFEDHPGLFLYHCHILEHEDQGMMRNFLVEA